MLNVKIDGLEELVKRYGQNIKPVIQKAIIAVAVEVQHRISPYPPAGAGNTPKSYVKGRWNTWYERGFGTKWARADGSVGGRATSQTLGRKWQNATHGNLGAKVTNTASYAGYVSGDKQTKTHAARGWVSEDKAVKSVISDGTVDRLVSKYITEALH